ncbi:hypothetical protein [Candidatus Nitrospira salsa]
MQTFKHITAGGSFLLCTTAWAALALANPALLPEHPGHPMKALESPVTGKSLANDPGRSQNYEQEALRNASQDANENLKTLTAETKEENKSNQSMNDVTASSSEQQ